MRSIIAIVAVLALIGFAVRAAVLNIGGHPQLGASIALGCTVLVIYLTMWVPTRPPPAGAARQNYAYLRENIQFENLGEFQDYVERDGSAERDEPAPPPGPPRRWLVGPGRVLIVVTWALRAVVAGYLACLVAQELDRTFHLTLLVFAAASRVLVLLQRVGQYLAGFRLSWAKYRGWAGVGTVASLVVLSVVAGYAFVLADFFGMLITTVPRFTYRTLDSLWHLPWLNIPIVVVVCVIGVIILTVVITVIQTMLARVFGPGNVTGAMLEERKLIKFEGDPRLLWQEITYWRRGGW
jgi:hypothetical protein